MAPTVQRNLQGFSKQPTFSFAGLDQRALLSGIQAISPTFNGFAEDELDEISPFITFVNFVEGDTIATAGEDASWVGVLLSGVLEALSADGNLLNTLGPGRIVGEMALFHGGRRNADLRGQEPGCVAALLFSDLPKLYEASAAAACKLMLAFGRAAVRKLELREGTPFSRLNLPGISRREDFKGSSIQYNASRFKEATAALVKKGFDAVEVELMLQGTALIEFHPAQVIFRREHTLNHFAIVLLGVVEQGALRCKACGPGDLVGEYEVLSGHPLITDAVGGVAGGVVAILSLEQLGEMAHNVHTSGGSPLASPDCDPEKGKPSPWSVASRGIDLEKPKVLPSQIAMKMFRLLGIAATSEPGGEGGMISLSFTGKETQSGMVARTVEVLYREKVRQAKARSTEMEEALAKETHDKKMNDILFKKTHREKEALQAQLASTSEELKARLRELRFLQKNFTKCAGELKAMREKAAQLAHSLKSLSEGSTTLQEISRLSAENARLNALCGAQGSELESATSRLDALAKRAEGMDARLKASTPHARLRWQRARLKLRLLQMQEILFDTSGELIKARDDATEAKIRHEFALADEVALRERLVVELRDMQSQNAVLNKALSKASEEYAQLHADHNHLVLTTREAVRACTTLEGKITVNDAPLAKARGDLDGVRAELHHARWEATEASEVRGKLSERLREEEVAHSLTTIALEQARAEIVHLTELASAARTDADAAESRAATAGHLAELRLREAAEARQERGRALGRLHEVERMLLGKPKHAAHSRDLPPPGVAPQPAVLMPVATLNAAFERLGVGELKARRPTRSQSSGRLQQLKPVSLHVVGGDGGSAGDNSVSAVKLPPRSTPSIGRTPTAPAPQRVKPPSRVKAITTPVAPTATVTAAATLEWESATRDTSPTDRVLRMPPWSPPAGKRVQLLSCS